MNIVSSLNLDGLKGGLVAREIGANIKNIAFPVNLHWDAVSRLDSDKSIVCPNYIVAAGNV